jgi:hypothetical protein
VRKSLEGDQPKADNCLQASDGLRWLTALWTGVEVHGGRGTEAQPAVGTAGAGHGRSLLCRWLTSVSCVAVIADSFPGGRVRRRGRRGPSQAHPLRPAPARSTRGVVRRRTPASDARIRSGSRNRDPDCTHPSRPHQPTSACLPPDGPAGRPHRARLRTASVERRLVRWPRPRLSALLSETVRSGSEKSMSSQNAASNVPASDRSGSGSRRIVAAAPPAEYDSRGRRSLHLVEEAVDRCVPGLLPLGQAVSDCAITEVDVDRLRWASFDRGHGSRGSC